MEAPHDLRPAAEQLAAVLRGVRDDQLGRPTPCAEWEVASLCGHVLGLSLAFTAAAGGPVASPEVSLTGDWRGRGADALDALAAAWAHPQAWTGDAEAGGVRMPAAEMGVVALDELVLHGWDLARATGQEVHVRAEDAAACCAFAGSVGPGEEERAGLYGPVVPVSADAPPLARLLGASGRDPAWAAGPAAGTGGRRG